MEKRPMGRTGDSSTILGFGCMRLPLSGPTPDKIDYDQATAMFRSAVDRGVDYVDTAYPYHGSGDRMAPGESEPFLGQALKGGYREKVKLATKLPSWKTQSLKEMHAILDEQLKRLDVSQIDYYLAHNLNNSVWPAIKDMGLFTFFDEAVKDGRIRFPSFSFHDDYPLFEEILKSYDWAMTQVQYNYLDRDWQAGRKGVKLAYDRGVAVVVMEPVRGGFLVNYLPDGPKETFRKAHPDWSLAAWCLNWIWAQKEISVVLTGVSDMAQTDDNVATALSWRPGKFTEEDSRIIDEVTEWFRSRLKAPCTSCAYCMPCPSGVNIPKNIENVNDYYIFDSNEARERSKVFYRMMVGGGESAALCTECGECLEKCPQHLEIPRLLKEAADLYKTG
ncbi:MAG: aldo/keto reductase [Deltaproteobacteria bacterium]|nr:aldo/keto reductase [Deltaproteobacteria bacterium]